MDADTLKALFGVDVWEAAEKGCCADLASAFKYVDPKLTRAGQTLLMRCAAKGHTEACGMLIAAGVPVNAQDADGFSALMFASQSGHTAVCEMLLDTGARLTLADRDHRTALWHAAAEGHSETVFALIARGADVNERSRKAFTPLIVAALHGHGALCWDLMAMGADVNAMNTSHKTAFAFACMHWNEPLCMHMIASGLDIMPSYPTASPLLAAADAGLTEVCASLLRLGADVDARDEDGFTPLMRAASINNAQTCALLLDHGADVNAHCPDVFMSALTLAAENGDDGRDVCAVLLATRRVNMLLPEQFAVVESALPELSKAFAELAWTRRSTVLRRRPRHGQKPAGAVRSRAPSQCRVPRSNSQDDAAPVQRT